jgi:hypothetical protein
MFGFQTDATKRNNHKLVVPDLPCPNMSARFLVADFHIRTEIRPVPGFETKPSFISAPTAHSPDLKDHQKEIQNHLCGEIE